jgi:hypothetical protein
MGVEVFLSITARKTVQIADYYLPMADSKLVGLIFLVYIQRSGNDFAGN